MIYDYCIVGQGLAGSILAYELLKKDKKVLVINHDSTPSSSRVAAGIYNPVTGKNLVKTWLADELFPFLEKYYSSIENDFNIKILHQTEIYRPFTNIEQQNHFLSQTANYSLEHIITDNVDEKFYNRFIINDLGGLKTLSAGWLNINVLLDTIHQYLIERAVLFNEKFDYNELKIEENSIEYKNLNIKKIIFCEGYHAHQNPLFSWLPFNPVKGEILDGKIENYDINEIVNQWIFILNQGNGNIRIGATYDWKNMDWQTTDEGKELLVEKLKKLLRLPFEITGQQAGIRPATIDRRPFLGNHPAHKNVYILNGFGTKGVSLAPYFAEMLIRHLESDEKISPEVNIERFYALYFQ
jgi:glycine/D-amino acid oxidase-like deaminating enzyme